MPKPFVNEPFTDFRRSGEPAMRSWTRSTGWSDELGRSTRTWSTASGSRPRGQDPRRATTPRTRPSRDRALPRGERRRGEARRRGGRRRLAGLGRDALGRPRAPPVRARRPAAPRQALLQRVDGAARSARPGSRPTATRPRRSTSCEYYAREALRYGEAGARRPDRGPERAPLRPDRGGRDHRAVELPAGDPCGMAAAALVDGQHGRHQAGRAEPDDRLQVLRAARGRGLPARGRELRDGAGPRRRAGDGRAPAHALHLVHGQQGGRAAPRRARRARRTTASAGSSASSPRWAARTRIVVDADGRPRGGGDGASWRRRSASRGRSARRARARSSSTSIYDAVLEKVVAKTKALKVGDPVEPGRPHGADDRQGPVRQDPRVHRDRRRRRAASSRAARAWATWATSSSRRSWRTSSRRRRLAQEEIFGPILAVIRAKPTGSTRSRSRTTRSSGSRARSSRRTERRLAEAKRRFHVGNLYLNRKCTGALVGAQPFGGFDMSGTCSKAGGPDYLGLFLQQKSISIHPI